MDSDEASSNRRARLETQDVHLWLDTVPTWVLALFGGLVGSVGTVVLGTPVLVTFGAFLGAEWATGIPYGQVMTREFGTWLRNLRAEYDSAASRDGSSVRTWESIDSYTPNSAPPDLLDDDADRTSRVRGPLRMVLRKSQPDVDKEA